MMKKMGCLAIMESIRGGGGSYHISSGQSIESSGDVKWVLAVILRVLNYGSLQLISGNHYSPSSSYL